MNEAEKNQVVSFALPEGRLLSGMVGMVEVVGEEGEIGLCPIYLGKTTPWGRVGMLEALLAREKGMVNGSWQNVD